MPDLDSTIHLDMLRRAQRRQRLIPRLFKAIKRELFSRDVYGIKWGDPETVPPLQFVRDRYVLPYVDPEQAAVEIGPGGGRWTRYLVDFKKLYAVEYHQELLDELRRYFSRPNIVFIKNNGTDFPGIDDGSIDFVFSFGTFVHIEPHLIRAYLANMKRILKPNANVILHYGDKTKIMGQLAEGFADNTPERMRAMVLDAGYTIVEEDLTTLWHSSIVRFQ